jgi:ribosomal protein L11 methyltransferase
MADSSKKWWRVRLTVDPEAEEPVSTILWDSGTEGISSHSTSDALALSAYFTDPPDPEQLRAKIEAFLSELDFPSAYLKRTELEQVVEEDWLQKWKEGYHPIAVGERFIIAPSWETPDTAGARIVIEIDPGMAFGTGTHATTQLCLTAMERHWRGGRFLDIGTGTGILAIAAAKMHPDAQVVAVDVDPIAIEVATENLAHNRVADNIRLQLGDLRCVRGQRFDLIAANLTAEVIEAHIADMKEALAEDGGLILSGVLLEQEASVQARLAHTGLNVIDRLTAEEWICLSANSRE